MSSRHSLAVVDNGAATSVLEGGRDAGRGVARDTLPAADPRLGMVLADTYRVTRNIASGGMGTVYEAMHVRLQQRFSIKFLDHHLARNTEAYARFRQEAEIAASLDHDAIVQVFDFNTDVDGNPYMVMEYVDGVTLDTWMQGRRATPREVIRMF
ncbi:MAG: protein kinase, partial [Myxococcales bacterium]|nr:protein kinase [Myxococcales bacterium]